MGANMVNTIAETIGEEVPKLADGIVATEGIQRGHMSLHARSVALNAAAGGEEVERVARRLAGDKVITLEHAQEILEALRGGNDSER